MKKKLVILISGSGSNLQAVIDAIEKKEIDYSIEAVISNNEDAFGLKRAEKAGIKALCFKPKKNAGLKTDTKATVKKLIREEYDAELAALVKSFKPDYIFLLGWMRILTDKFIGEFDNKILNLHPALPGTFPGTDAIERQYKAFMAGEISKCGIMTHFVPDEGVDSGPVIFTQEVPVSSETTLEEFEASVHKAEHKLVVKTLKELL